MRRHKWGDACIRHMSQSCSVIVARKGSILTSAKGASGDEARRHRGDDTHTPPLIRRQMRVAPPHPLSPPLPIGQRREEFQLR